jgi:hypothetical protein
METIYRIKYSYYTGNSFGSEDREDVLEFEWKDLEKVKEALQRIKEHYAWYKSIEESRSSWRDVKELEKPTWHKLTGNYIDKYNEHNMLNLEMDNGNEVQFWAPWCGYFEGLYGAQIVVDGDEMSFEI